MKIQAFQGLQALLESAFPKRCPSCGYVYSGPEQFFNETGDMPGGRSSLKSFVDDDGFAVVEVFRNCRCGSTLMDEFVCRRDMSEPGSRNREEFQRLLQTLTARGIADETARAEILKFMLGAPNRLRLWLEDDQNPA
ncbi:hypothetical protein NP603_06510 [Methylomonas sp. SURF-1]|uniref:Oxidoreductase n=1 Tax=Methylomonas aurea TaxID=2952224 RepID=A0ABT1UEU3_9GAMM|nr:hypothetical protein [Methylomonas sp. SURF-1]MCQ8180752.1 hypothetical protein [Methylomonas sp. SURF-1]